MLNLKSRYGKLYKVRTEQGATKDDPWGMIVECKYGHLYLHGPNAIGAATNTRGSVAKRLAALPGVTVTQDGSDGLNAVFAPAAFDAVAAVMQPCKRRHGRKLTDVERVRLVNAGKAFRFEPEREPDGPTNAIPAPYTARKAVIERRATKRKQAAVGA